MRLNGIWVKWYVCVCVNRYSIVLNFISQASTYGTHECYTMEMLDDDFECNISKCLAGIRVQGNDASPSLRPGKIFQ